MTCFVEDKGIKEIRLVGFSDASKTGYAVCIYLSKSSKILVSKTRTTSFIEQGIPQIKLFGSLILTRIKKKNYRSVAV